MAEELLYHFHFSSADFSRIRTLVLNRLGIKLSEQKKGMVYSRLSRRLRALGFKTFGEYLGLLETRDTGEWQEFVSSITTHLTAFFREHYHFPILAQHMASRPARETITVWSSAASTGEEAFSIAITAAEHFGTLAPPVKIIATDVDALVLDTARAGVYPEARISGLSSQLQKRYFLKGTASNNGLVKIRPELQKLITFIPLNLLDHSWPFQERFDAIFCRNVMIYFDQQTQSSILRHCVQHLKPDGLFFAGHSENLHHAADILKSCGKTVYQPRCALRSATI